MTTRRIVSFLPAATEMLFALGVGEQIVGVSHECDFPDSAKEKPVVVRPALPLATMSLQQIDEAVSARLRNGDSVYTVDGQLLAKLEPDLIVTQNLCQVCAPSGNEITRLLKQLPKQPKIIYLTPHSLNDIFNNLLELANATGCSETGERLISHYKARIRRITGQNRSNGQQAGVIESTESEVGLLRSAATKPTDTLGSSPPRVFCCEWVDPVYCCGHWVPQMVEIAGGVDPIARTGHDSVRIKWEDVLSLQPEIFVVMPCGFALTDAIAQTQALASRPGWNTLPAVRNNRVYAVDANSYFARPGPRVIDGIELLAHLIQPDRFPWTGPPSTAFAKVTT